MITTLLLAIGVGYFLGAIPCGYLVARAKGVNIFEVGSKNPGATNVLRTLGKGPGYLTFALDALKGATAVLWLPLCSGLGCPLLGPLDAESLVWAKFAGLLAAIIGHTLSCFTRFKGGKGVATAGGAFFVLLPLPTFIALALWLAVFFVFRYVSLASIVAAAAIPASAWILGAPLPFTLLSSVVGVLVIARHHANISRLLAGTENKFVRKSDQPKVP